MPAELLSLLWFIVWCAVVVVAIGLVIVAVWAAFIMTAWRRL